MVGLAPSRKWGDPILRNPYSSICLVTPPSPNNTRTLFMHSDEELLGPWYQSATFPAWLAFALAPSERSHLGPPHKTDVVFFRLD